MTTDNVNVEELNHTQLDMFEAKVKELLQKVHAENWTEPSRTQALNSLNSYLRRIELRRNVLALDVQISKQKAELEKRKGRKLW